MTPTSSGHPECATVLTEHWLSLLSLRVCVPRGAAGTDSGPRGGGLCSRRGDKQLTPVVLGHLARGHHWGKDDLLTPESSWASPVVSLNRVTRAGDTEQKEPSLAGVRWPQGATCASCPPLGLARLGKEPQERGLGALPCDPGQNPVPGQGFSPASTGDWPQPRPLPGPEDTLSLRVGAAEGQRLA